MHNNALFYPQPPATGGFPPSPPMASGGWGICPQPPAITPMRISGYATGCLVESYVFRKIEKINLW